MYGATTSLCPGASAFGFNPDDLAPPILAAYFVLY